MSPVDAPTAAHPPPRSRARPGHFIPIGKHDLVERVSLALLSDAPSRATFELLSQLIDATIHHEHHQRLERLKQAYAPFDPDSDFASQAVKLGPEREAAAERVFDELAFLLGRANFHALSRAELLAAIGAMSHWGVNWQLDLGIFRRVEVFARGERIDVRTRRSWTRGFRLEKHLVPIYTRFAIAYRLHEDHPLGDGFHHDLIYLRFFKNIPELDVDMTLPGGKVKMTLLDHGKIIFPTFSGLVMAIWKILKGALIVAAVGFYGLLAYIGLLVGTLGAGWRSVFGYLRTKEKYQLNLAQSLYYQNLDNNLGVLCRVASEAEDQEFREALVAYALLALAAPAEGWTPEELDTQANAWLQTHVGPDVDFETHDALEKLARWRLVQLNDQGRLVAPRPDAALALLDESWDNMFRPTGNPRPSK